MTEIPKRRFALEEKDLSIEADENNKIAEEKENLLNQTNDGDDIVKISAAIKWIFQIYLSIQGVN